MAHIPKAPLASSSRELRRNIKCKLEDGTICMYDVAGNSPTAYDSSKFRFIGKGCYHTVDGIKQSGQYLIYFFVKI